MGCVEQLVMMLSREHSQDHEHLMATLLELLTDHELASREAARPQLCLLELLNDRISLVQDCPEFEVGVYLSLYLIYLQQSNILGSR